MRGRWKRRMRCFALARCYDATSYDATAQGDEVGAAEQGVREMLRRKAASADLLCQWQPKRGGKRCNAKGIVRGEDGRQVIEMGGGWCCGQGRLGWGAFDVAYSRLQSLKKRIVKCQKP